MTENSQHYYLRWTKTERYQHWILVVCFTLLAVTGFALKYHDAWWVQPLLILEGRFGLRGWLHRLAAVLFMALALYHAGYILFTPRGRAQLKALRLRRQDWDDFKTNVQFWLGKRTAPPEFDHFSYMEKLEYWALAWGALVMAFTGFLLWFEDLSMQIFPFWILEVFTIIHLYEAWLATLAIFVWHLYAVVFSPQVYPLNMSMVDGRMSEAEMQKEHGRELACLRAQAKGEEETEARDDHCAVTSQLMKKSSLTMGEVPNPLRKTQQDHGVRQRRPFCK
jgi:formate dehydrogenase gamma subunit